MFFRLSVFKKLIKSAYKRTGFYLGQDREKIYYYIRTPRFVVWFNAESMPKQAKAAVIEFSGELPEPGEEFLCSEAQECNQYSFLGTDYSLFEIEQKAKAKFHITKISDVSTDSRYMYSKIEDRVVNSILIPESILAMIDAGAIDTANGEIPPIGPVATGVIDNQVFWYNNTSALLVMDVLEGSDDEAKSYAMALAELEANSK